MNLSIEQYHEKINSSILLLKGYLEEDYIPFLIKSCRLKPAVGNLEDYSTQLYQEWMDDFGNTIHFKKVKRKIITITENDISLDRKRISISDLYSNLKIQEISTISKKLFFVTGEDEDLGKDFYLLTFLGNDNFLRTYVYIYGEWKQYSPLSLGLPTIKWIHSNLNLIGAEPYSIKNFLIYPCLNQKAWITSWTPKESLLKKLDRREKQIIKKLIWR